jgi:hypothetical protein
MSLELVKTKNEEFQEEYPNMVKKIKNKQLQEFEPKLKEIEGIYKIIIDFIIEKKRKIYGGYALNMLLSNKDKKLELYDEMDIKTADIDFYTPEPIKDMIELCIKLNDAGYKPIEGREADHKDTYSIFVNYRLFCDLTYVPNNIYKKARFIEINKFYVIHPWFMMIDYFRMFTDPMISYWRLEKHFERYMKIQKSYPLPLVQKPLIMSPYKNKNITKAIDMIFDFVTDKETILITGFYIYNYYLYSSDYKKYNKKYDYVNIPYLEIYSINYVKDALDILNYIKSISELSNNITHAEFYPFFQFYGYNFVLYYNDGKEKVPILYFYSNNKRCIPYKKVDYIKFDNSNNNDVIIDKNKKINIGCFDHNILHALIILVKVRVDDDNEWNDVLYKYINGLVTFRNYFLDKNKETIYSDSIFQGFVIDCIGETVDPKREKRLNIELRKKLKKPYVFKYDPTVSKANINYKFSNSSGNQITNQIYLKITEENLAKQLIGDLDIEEITDDDTVDINNDDIKNTVDNVDITN